MQSANARYCLVFGGYRRPDAGARVGAAGLVGEVGAVEVRAQNARAVRCVRLQPPTQLEESEVLLVAGHGRGRQEARRAVAGVCPARGAKRLLGAVHEVGAGAPVDVKVDEARCQIAALQVDAGPVVALCP